MDHPTTVRRAAPRPDPGGLAPAAASPDPPVVPPPDPSDAAAWTVLGGGNGGALRSDSLWEMALKGHGDVPLLAQPRHSPTTGGQHRSRRPPAWSVVGFVVLVLCFMGAVLVLGEGGPPRRAAAQVVTPEVSGSARPDPRATAISGRAPATTTTTSAPVPGGPIPGVAAAPSGACSATLSPAAGGSAVLDVDGVPPSAPVTVRLGRGAQATSTTTVADASGVATATLDLRSLPAGQPAVVTVFAGGGSCQTVFATTPPVAVPSTTTTTAPLTTTTVTTAANTTATTTAATTTTTTEPGGRTTTTTPPTTSTTAAANRRAPVGHRG